MKWIFLGLLIIVVVAGGWLGWDFGWDVYAIDEPVTGDPSDCHGSTRFAVIGDYGLAGQPLANVASMIDSWPVDFIVTVGDNNYPKGKEGTIDDNIGQYFHQYIFPYKGKYGSGSATGNRFFPTLGNHDWGTDSAQPYLDYFALPGNERYYEFVAGSVHFFVLDSDPHEPDGRTVDSVQADWLQSRLAAATAPWKLIILHHAPYSSSANHGSDVELQWPYAKWGAAAVLAGHDHTYERLEADGIPYFVNGLGGKSLYRIYWAIPESVVRYNRDYGAMLVQADETCINFSFYARTHKLIDSYTINK